MRFLAATVTLAACHAEDPDEVSSSVPGAGQGRDFQLCITQVCAPCILNPADLQQAADSWRAEL